MAIIDCHDRTIVGYELSLRGRAKEAERALEAACRALRDGLPERADAGDPQ